MKRIIFSISIMVIVSSSGFTAFAQGWTPATGILYNNPITTKIGIGMTNPSELLQVNGILKVGNSSSATDRAKGMIKIGDSDYIRIGEWEADDMLSFKASRYNFTNGNVGIGTINPLHKLHVVDGNILISRTVNGGAPGSTNGMIMFGSSDVGNGTSYGEWAIEYLNNNQEGYGLNFAKAWAALPGFNYALFLGNNGNVGIGTKNAQSKLTVNGAILCEEVKVIADVPDADYVFEKDYNLAPLSEVETFIKENKHLPNIPSAQEFKDNGYKVGEMDGMLLRKVEELTLYIIELEKQIKELKEANKKGGE
jgi:hypothetical protein